MLLPIYEDLEDGAEILWTERRRIPLARIEKLAKSKQQLSVSTIVMRHNNRCSRQEWDMPDGQVPQIDRRKIANMGTRFAPGCL